MARLFPVWAFNEHTGRHEAVSQDDVIILKHYFNTWTSITLSCTCTVCGVYLKYKRAFNTQPPKEGPHSKLGLLVTLKEPLQ